jgi:hypothetical protein
VVPARRFSGTAVVANAGFKFLARHIFHHTATRQRILLEIRMCPACAAVFASTLLKPNVWAATPRIYLCLVTR